MPAQATRELAGKASARWPSQRIFRYGPAGTSIEDIADAAGQVNPNVTRAVYRHQISDTVTRAPAALDQALAVGGE